MMSGIINFLFNKKLVLVVASTTSFLAFVIYLMMKFFIGYGGLIETIFYVMLFLFLFFALVLIFVDKEEAKNWWIMIGLGFLSGFWNIFG